MLIFKFFISVCKTVQNRMYEMRQPSFISVKTEILSFGHFGLCRHDNSPVLDIKCVCIFKDSNSSKHQQASTTVVPSPEENVYLVRILSCVILIPSFTFQSKIPYI